MPFHDRAIFPRGFRCASINVGLKPIARDLSLFVSDLDANAAAVFTRNHFPGAPIILGRETIKGGRLRATDGQHSRFMRSLRARGRTFAGTFQRYQRRGDMVSAIICVNWTSTPKYVGTGTVLTHHDESFSLIA